MGEIVELKPATIAKLDLGPDDVVVVHLNTSLPPDRIDRIGQTVKEAVGDHKVLVVADNISIEVVAKREIEELPPGPEHLVTRR